MTWDPAQYLKFAGHRLRPALDLLNRIDLDAPRVVYDLGSGAGNVTRLVHDRWPGARVTGVDDSEAMLAKASAAAPDITWQRADLRTWSPAHPPDLVYSNAALHWLGEHDRLFPALLRTLAPGGVLAVQMPRNFAAPSHTAMAEVARAGGWRQALEPLLGRPFAAEAAFYFDVLSPISAALDIWETEYLHVLDGVDPVKEWVKGSALKPLLDALAEPDRSRFEAAYAARVRAAYPPRAGGQTLFPFRRLFIVAQARG